MANQQAGSTERQIERWLSLWEKRWHLPWLRQKVKLRFSARLHKSWARARVTTGHITVSVELLEHESLLEEVLCHEAAHVAAYSLIGANEPPHGPTWRSLVILAGHEPLRRLPGVLKTSVASSANRKYEHRCPICHFTRRAPRPNRRWRCADCVAAGLSGELVITPVAAPS